MKIRGLILYCIGILFMLSSCGITLEYPVEYPPVRYIKEGERNVLVVTHFFSESIVEGTEGKREVIINGAEEAFRGAVESLNELPGFKAKSVSTPIGFYMMANADSIMKAHDVQYLFSLNSIDATMDRAHVERTKDEDGNVSKEAFYNLIVSSEWSFFKLGEGRLETFPVVEERPYSSRAVISGLLAAGPSIKNAGSRVNEQAWLCGNTIGRSFLPISNPVARHFYTGKDFKESGHKVMYQRYSDAVQLLEQISHSGNSKERGRALYNMAVCYEAMGAPEDALEACEKSADLNNAQAKALLPQLDLHLKTIRAFENQTRPK